MALPRAQPKPFNLVRSFGLRSLLTIGVTTAVTATLLTNFLVDRQLERDAIYTMQFFQSVLQTGQQDRYFASVHESGDGDWDGFFSRISDLPDVIRANVFSRSGTIIWSSDSELIGRRFEHNTELEEALEGKVEYELEDIRDEAKEEHVYFPEGVVEFIENYVPIWSADGSRVIGVVEVYRAPRALFRSIEQARLVVLVNAVLGAALLYAILFWIVRRAHRLLCCQQERLLEYETVSVVGEMAAAVAHGIRNPLASIRATAQLAHLQRGEGLSSEDAQDIIEASDRIEVWIRDLLRGSNPAEGDLAEVHLDKVVEECLDVFRTPSERQQVESKLEVGGPIPAIHGDPLLLEQMFNGLIANALEAMPSGGTLRVDISKPDAHSVAVEIADTGSGIPCDQVGQVFKPFYTSKPNGIGVGLMIGRRIAERHGAQMDLTSQEGRGTNVSVVFPLRAA